MPFPNPRWLEELPEGPAKVKARTRFLIRLAALYSSEDGFAKQMAIDIGAHRQTLNQGMLRWTTMPPWLCRKIEDTLGSDLFPVEYLNPEIFKAK